MAESTLVLLSAAASIGFLHTLVGVDHYLPFIVFSKSGNWSLGKTLRITFLCGLGHVVGSVVLGMVGLGLGLFLRQLELVESFRGELAAWGLLSFGLLYFVWGMRRARCRLSHEHLHTHLGGVVHRHSHTHAGEHLHVHEREARMTPWVLFVVFALGPCESLIPLLMYPAANSGLAVVLAVTGLFAAVTLVTMCGLVMLGTVGLSRTPSLGLERYQHALAGLSVFLSGVILIFLGV